MKAIKVAGKFREFLSQSSQSLKSKSRADEAYARPAIGGWVVFAGKAMVVYSGTSWQPSQIRFSVGFTIMNGLAVADKEAMVTEDVRCAELFVEEFLTTPKNNHQARGKGNA